MNCKRCALPSVVAAHKQALPLACLRSVERALACSGCPIPVLCAGPPVPRPPTPTRAGLCLLPPALITEYCARGSLYDCLSAAKNDPAAATRLTWARRLAMVRAPHLCGRAGCWGTATAACPFGAELPLNSGPPPSSTVQAVDAGTGLVYLHGRNIVHRDGACGPPPGGGHQRSWCSAANAVFPHPPTPHFSQVPQLPGRPALARQGKLGVWWGPCRPNCHKFLSQISDLFYFFVYFLCPLKHGTSSLTDCRYAGL